MSGRRKTVATYVDPATGHSRLARDGCEVSPTCLACPLPVCRYDDPAPYQAYLRELRDRPILEALASEPAPRVVARRLGVAVRTVHRAMERARERGTA